MSEKQNIPSLLAGADPLFWRGNGVGCLCLHGLTASPSEMGWLGEHLADQGYTVYAPRIAGHGADYRDLRRLTWHDWYLSVVDAYHVLRSQCDQIFVTGLSMGGLLSLLLGASYPIDGLVVMASPIQPVVPHPQWLINMIKQFQPFQTLPDESDFPDRLREEQRKRGEEDLGRVRYDVWATYAVLQINRLIEAVQQYSTQVTMPTRLIYSKSDQTVPYEHLQDMLELLTEAQVDAYTLEHSGHIMTQDMERETVFDLVTEFIQSQLG